jgi:hypothetical protein
MWHVLYSVAGGAAALRLRLCGQRGWRLRRRVEHVRPKRPGRDLNLTGRRDC